MTPGTIKHPFRDALVFLAAHLLLIWVALAESSLPLPPPPEAEPPAVNVAMLSFLGPQQRPEPVLPTFESSDPEVHAVLESLRRKVSTEDTLEQILFSQLRAEMPSGGEDVIFDQAVLPSDLEMNDAGWTANFDFRMPRNGIGRATYTGTIVDSQGSPLKRFSGSVLIDREVNAIQVRRMLRRGEILRNSDFAMVRARLSQLPRGVLDETEMALGTEAQSELRPGQWLEARSVKRPMLIQRNQAVTIELRRGMIHITAPGLTRQPGAAGEIIKVTNIQSGREIYARVTSPDTVQVLY